MDRILDDDGREEINGNWDPSTGWSTPRRC